ncbi:MmgE/PrpD family protein [Ramlibacter sp.]|uniref:MmgE/PrpD family protein n=1 Tax=Ramlibacter sp. TaxID=1917967 RepID=UPI003D0BEE44
MATTGQLTRGVATPQQREGMSVRLAEYIARVANAPLTEADVEAVRRLMLDNFIISLWGERQPWTRELRDWAKRFAGTGTSPVLGADWTADASIAALIHGTASHSYELDDAHDETLSHPGSVIIPSALAVGATLGSSQMDLMRAVTVGYESMALVGCTASGMDTVHAGFHPTSTFGSLGAAAACASLRAYKDGEKVTADLIVRAWGHGLSQACGSMQFSAESGGGAVKRVHAGYGARNGVESAEFARLPAITGPAQPIEGTYGLAAMFGGELRHVEPASMLQIHRISLKPYSTCRLFHSTIDALDQLTDGFTMEPDRIERITVRGHALIRNQHMQMRPTSPMAAQYSCPYIVGATLAYGPRRFAAYSGDYLNDRKILDIVERVRFEESEELSAYYPQRYATGVEFQFRDGTSRSAVVIESRGTPDKPLSREEILAKADGLAEQGQGAPGRHFADLLWDPEQGALRIAQVFSKL